MIGLYEFCIHFLRKCFRLEVGENFDQSLKENCKKFKRGAYYGQNQSIRIFWQVSNMSQEEFKRFIRSS